MKKTRRDRRGVHREDRVEAGACTGVKGRLQALACTGRGRIKDKAGMGWD